MDDSTLQAIERACGLLYATQSPDDRFQAESTLAYHFPTFADYTFTTVPNASPTTPTSPADVVVRCQILLERSSFPYAQLFAANHLKSLILSQFTYFSNAQKLELNSFVLNYLSRRSGLENIISTQLIQLYSIVCKMGWFDSDDFQNVMNDVSPFLQSTVEHQIIGVQILGNLVQEMNSSSNSTKNLSKHRKTAVNFRDNQLLPIFKISITMLSQLLMTQPSSPKDQVGQLKLREATLVLMKSCLTFDFIGTNPDESSEDVGSNQIPNAWKGTISDPSFLQSLFGAYKSFPPPLSSQVMECLAIVMSTRRSLFSDDEKANFLTWSMQVTHDILHYFIKLNDPGNYHEFCRLLVRLKTVNQLGEIIEKPNYNEWIDKIASFTIKSFHSMTSENCQSIQYLLTFWSKMAGSVTTTSRAKLAQYERLEQIASQLVQAFINSRMSDLDANNDEDEVFDADGSLLNTLESLAVIVRLKYDSISAYIKSVFDSLAGQYEDILKRPAEASAPARLLIEAKFTWCVYLIGASVGERTPYQTTDEQDVIDGDLTSKVLQLLNVNHTFIMQNGQSYANEKLIIAFLFFFQQFRKSYIGDQASRATKVYVALSEVLGINDQYMVLNIIVQTLGNNLKYCWSNETIISQSLQLFNDLVTGYMSVKQMRRSEMAQFILNHHTSEYFPFLDVQSNFKHRALYYTALCKLLNGGEEQSDLEFLNFMRPFTLKLEELCQITDIQTLRQPNVGAALEGIFRDLRGFLAASLVKKQYALFFEWFLPYIGIVGMGLKAHFNNRVGNALLKFVNELVQNRAQRLNFDITSADGILLFRETSKILHVYSQLLKNAPAVSGNQLWSDRYKGITTCLNILRWSLAGQYVNFGVFALYNDQALVVALNVVSEMVLQIPMKDIMAYSKLCSAYFSFIDVFSSKQMMEISDLDPNFLLYILRSCGEGLRSVETLISTLSCNTIDYIVTFLFKQSQLEKRRVHYLIRRFQEMPQIIPFLLSRLMEVILTDDPQNQWSLSRPLLVLALLSPEYFEYYTQTLVHFQVPERQEFLRKCFASLMDGIEQSVASKNREKFTQQLLRFRRELNSEQVIVLVPKELQMNPDS
ncbi:exportin-7 [Polychytrium aggregatum]|uniref:exportin-7 n=1 Tax=Polychytrium aggregatum TaxID=110093 RepID=UPI0022FED912|nr:exportin-7 [Polychytrium aggregatum]KAI9208668.1 exportin-7 [Polychytrium aggregatum]